MEQIIKVKDEPPEGEANVKDEPPDSLSNFEGSSGDVKSEFQNGDEPRLDALQKYQWLHYNHDGLQPGTERLSCWPCSQVSVASVEFPLDVALTELSAHESKDSHTTAMALICPGLESFSDNLDDSSNLGDAYAEQHKGGGPLDYLQECDQRRQCSRSHYERYKRKRKFCAHWLDQFRWLRYDEEQNKMYCRLCEKYCSASSSSFVREGNNSFKLVSIQSHMNCKDHRRSVQADEYTNATEEDHLSRLDPKSKFVLNKFLSYFPWMNYKAEVNMITCSICQKHGTNTMFLQLAFGTMGLDYKLIKCHTQSKNHLEAEVQEILSWGDEWEGHGGLKVDEESCQNSSMNGLELENIDEIENEQLRKPGRSTDSPELRSDETSQASGETDTDDNHNGLAHHPAFQAFGYSSGTLSNDHQALRYPVFGTFQRDWLASFPWLKYNETLNSMSCTLCAKHQKKNLLAGGTRVFKRSCLVDHSVSVKHCAALSAELHRDQLEDVTQQAVVSTSVPVLRKSSSVESHSSSEDSGLGAQDGETAELSDSSVSASIIAHSQQDDPILDGVIQIEPIPEERGHKRPADNAEADAYEKKRVRRFQPSWKEKYDWLEFDPSQNLMFCIWCEKFGKSQNPYSVGSSNFRLHAIKAHDESDSHRKSRDHLFNQVNGGLPIRDVLAKMAQPENKPPWDDSDQ